MSISHKKVSELLHLTINELPNLSAESKSAMLRLCEKVYQHEATGFDQEARHVLAELRKEISSYAVDIDVKAGERK